MGKRYRRPEDAVKGTDDKIRVLEYNKKRQIDRSIDDQYRFGFIVPLLSVCRDQPSADIVQADGEQHQQDINRFAPPVKNQIDNEQPKISGARRNKIVYRQHRRQVVKEKNYA